MIKKLFVTLILFCISLPVVSAQNKIEYDEYNLDNGLHVILHKDVTAPIVAVTVMYHVGSKNEKPNRTGFAHFFEHLMFEGSPNIPRGQYFKIVQNAGGQLNANTDFDRTFYYEVLPSNQLALGLWLESERMLHLKIDSIGVETQREVVKEERRQNLDNRPYGTIMEQTFKHAYTVHPYRWMPIGSAQYIDKASIDEFRNFYKTYYVPNNATLTISGDINIDQTKDLIKKYFAGIPKGTKKMYRPTEVEPMHNAEVVDTVYDNIQLPAVIEAYHIPSVCAEDYPAVDMLTTLLSTGRSSRLYKSLVDKTQKAVNVGAYAAGLEDPGLFLTYAIANSGVNAGELQKLIDEQIDNVKNNLISEHEFEKLRNQTETGIVSANATDLGVAQNLATAHVICGNTNRVNTALDRYMKVTREDLKRVADKYLIKKDRVVLYYLPKSAQQSKEGK